MIVHRYHKYRIYPSKEQEERLIRWESGLRFLWNCALEQRLNALRLSKLNPDGSKNKLHHINKFDQCKELKDIKKTPGLEWFGDLPRHSTSAVLDNLEDAWKRCFKKVSRKPKFKKKGGKFIGITEFDKGAWDLDLMNSLLRFPKIGKMRIKITRPLGETLSSCTIIRDVDQWFVNILCKIEIPDPIQKAEPIVGIDRGVINLLADSDGKLVENPKFYHRSLKKLKKGQRNVSRKAKGSSNYKKAQLKVSKVNRKIRRQRQDFIHNLSSQYTKSHGIIVLEKLNIEGMLHRSRGLSRSILDSGWGYFNQFLKYKMIMTGGNVIEINPSYTSQECSNCHHISKESRKTQSEFCCINCGFKMNADLNAALNIQRRGRSSMKPVEDTQLLMSPVKQEIDIVISCNSKGDFL